MIDLTLLRENPDQVKASQRARGASEALVDQAAAADAANRKALGEFGSIAGRKVFLKKQSGNLGLTIFEGNHEMLTEYAFNELIKD